MTPAGGRSAPGTDVERDRQRGVPPLALAGVAYAVLVLIMWGAFSPYSGLPSETAFPYMSETDSVLGGFLYRADPLRIHTNTFYHLSYLTGEVLGIGGSYVPYQVVYALLWWARGFLVFLLLRKFLPGRLAVCYVAGALAVVHASDGALQWIGQMNQFGFMFWMLAAFYLLTLAYQTPGPDMAVFLTMAACVLEYMSLWSYESQILLLLVFPLALPLFLERRWRRLAAVSVAWYSVPCVYAVLTITKYANAAGQTYQESVMRKGGWGLTALLGDWAFNVRASLEFWNWAQGEWKAPHREVVLLALLTALLFAAGAAAIIHRSPASGGPSARMADVRIWWALLGAGFVLLVLSFPVYLLLNSARSLYRTQLLSGIGSGLVLTALAGLASQVLGGRAVRLGAFVTLAAVIVYFGSESAIQKGARHRWVWEQHRSAIIQILRVAPSVKPDAVIVLAKVPKESDPFRHNMWFDLALRLVYPGIPVSGVYFYDDGGPSPGNNLKAEGERWKWDGTGFPPVLRDTTLANTVVIDYDQSGVGRVATTIPSFLCEGRCATQLYDPAAVIARSLSPRAARRYRLESAPALSDRGDPAERDRPAAKSVPTVAVLPTLVTSTLDAHTNSG